MNRFETTDLASNGETRKKRFYHAVIATVRRLRIITTARPARPPARPPVRPTTGPPTRPTTRPNPSSGDTCKYMHNAFFNKYLF